MLIQPTFDVTSDFFFTFNGLHRISITMPEPVSSKILMKAAAGDHRAFREIVEKHQAFVYALAYRMVGNSADAEDITQDAFVRLWKHMPGYKREVKVSTWLYQITTNVSLDLLKSAHRRRSKVSIQVELVSNVVAAARTEAMIERQELCDHIQRAVAKLPPVQKAVFVLRHLEMLTVAETGAALSMNTDQVKANFCHARKAVAKTIASIYRTD